MNKNGLYWLILLVVASGATGAIYYQYENSRPCVHPIKYTLGTVDSRFGISQAAVIGDMQKATAIWNKVAGKDLFVYDPSASLTVNFVYDEREETAKLGISIAGKQSELDSSRTALDSLQKQLRDAQNSYNTKVEAVNARGGANPSEVAALNAERASLASLTTNVNNQIAAFNASVRDLNATIKEFNQTAGHTFEEGQYVRDASGERINIFEFVGATQLTRVLAHEFGHAVGLDHNDDPKSIMYAKNESGNLVPSEADIAALKALCRIDK